MLKFLNVTTKEDFLSYKDWARQQISPMTTQCSGTQAWKISDHFGNTWDVTFSRNGGELTASENDGEFTVGGMTTNSSPFKVYLHLCGDAVEIVMATENGRTIRSDRLLKKYRELSVMVSNYLRFNLLGIEQDC